MTMAPSVWEERADGYRHSEAHRTGADLDLMIELCEGAEGVAALDVATGGGHVAAIEWLLKMGIICQVGPGADCLDLDILDLGGGRSCHAQSHGTRNGCGRGHFVSGFQHYEISLLSLY